MDSQASELFAMMKALDTSKRPRSDGSIRAPFGYPGGKGRSLGEIMPRLPYRYGYAEPFGGSGALFIAREPSKLEIFNDRYAGVVAFYRCIRDRVQVQKLIERLELTVHAREEFEWCLATWESCTDDVERAARWYYMTTTSFNSKGWSFGRSTASNCSMGRKLQNSLSLFNRLHLRFRHAQVENLDWRQCLGDFDKPNMVWYLDPPYWGTHGVYQHEFTEQDHYELCERIQHLQGFVALSGYQNPCYDKYPWTAKHSWEVEISALGQAFNEENNLKGLEDQLKRGKATEVLWIKDAA